MKVLGSALARQQNLTRYLSYLFQRHSSGRLNLVVGAGTSADAGIPMWDDLLDRLASRSQSLQEDLKKHRAARLAPEYLGQIIYHRHRTEWRGKATKSRRQAHIDHDWATSIYDSIYKDVPTRIDDIVKKHPYLTELAKLSCNVSVVINFNFDDVLSEAMGFIAKSAIDGNRRPHAVVWHPPIVDRANAATVYHVNGILPRVSLKKRSPELVFTEDSFAAALAKAPEANSQFLFMRFVQNTMLVIGHSLADSSLKNFLRRSRSQYPANHHFMIHWLNSKDAMSTGQMKDLFDANLELYNLITIFLTSTEIKEFLSLLVSNEASLREFLETYGPDRRASFHFYVVGPVASGKSSLIEKLRCFNTFEEWTRPPPPEMYLSFEKLSDEQKVDVDTFIYSELREKNILMNKAGVGFHFMDRAPLDLYAFSEDAEEQRSKTNELRERVTRNRRFQDGEIVFVTARGNTLEERNIRRGRLPDQSGDRKYLAAQSKALRQVYKPKIVLTTDRTEPDELAQQVARRALMGEFNAQDLMAIMDKYS